MQGQLFEGIAGVDEAGRGPLAGPVFAAAVILPPSIQLAGLNDSKQCSLKKRERLFDEIQSTAIAYAIATASVEEIDELNILQASLLAMQRAVMQLGVAPSRVLVDGRDRPKVPYPCEAIIDGDSLVPVISAASILAKVARDRAMLALAEQYPGYAFEKHKGYGTKLHMERLFAEGPCPIHRRSFAPVQRALSMMATERA